MPTASVPGGRIYYSRWSRARADAVLLIHGAMATGWSDWGNLAPILAESREVVVPDCPAHGRSTVDDGFLYRFADLADRLADLLRVLGLGPVHVVGHSNGGNVALLLLVRQPSAVRSAVLQAANGEVTPGLEALRNADPRAVSPQERRRYERLHDRWQGSGHWIRLYRATMEETASQPRLAADVLGGITCPTLLIEGRKDRFNASAGHAAYLHRSILSSELWQPDTGHAPHRERPGDWLARVSEFWSGRGSPAGNATWHFLRSCDPRHAPARLQCLPEPRGPVIRGSVCDAPQLDALVAATRPHRARVEVRVLATSAPGVVGVRPIADLRSEPRDMATRVSQLLCGERAAALDSDSGWTLVRLERDGYVGWVRPNRIAPAPAPAAPTPERWIVVEADWASLHESPRGPVFDRVPFGVRLPASESRLEWHEVALPDGLPAWLASEAVRVLGPDEPLYADMRHALERFSAFVGVPYLWGGRTPFGFDCSGLTQAWWGSLGRSIPRDADQQWSALDAVDRPEVGDIVFFDSRGAGTPDHVGVYLGGSRLLHAWGATGAVTISSLSPADHSYEPRLADWYVGAGRPPG